MAPVSAVPVPVLVQADPLAALVAHPERAAVLRRRAQHRPAERGPSVHARADLALVRPRREEVAVRDGLTAEVHAAAVEVVDARRGGGSAVVAAAAQDRGGAEEGRVRPSAIAAVGSHRSHSLQGI